MKLTFTKLIMSNKKNIPEEVKQVSHTCFADCRYKERGRDFMHGFSFAKLV